MIYLITDNPDKFPLNPIYRLGSRELVLEWLSKNIEVPLDCETRGFDPYTKKLLSIQIGDYDNQFIVDCESMSIDWLKEPLESKILIGQNIKFDLKFLYHQGIYPRKIYDTFIAEKIINCGIDYLKSSLDAITERYLKVTLDKSVRVDIPKEGLTPRVLSYAADDIKYLPQIKEKQLKKLEEQDLIVTMKMENQFTPALAYIEYCGFKLDAEKWKEKMSKDLETTKELIDQLNNYVFEHDMQDHIEQQLDMFQEQKCTVNWSSPNQMVKFFESIGIDCTVKVGGILKKSVEQTVIEKYSADHEIVRIYLEFKKAEKVVTTYGETFLTQINEVTGRVHTNFKQILNTGRTSSGGKDSDKKINLINFQNIPADKLTRSCFVAEPGNTLIISDYAGQEQIVLANMSMDENLLKFYDEGLADMHSFVCSKMYPELEGLTLDEIKSKHKDKRQEAKSAGFAINYGGNGSTIATNLNISTEAGDRIYNGYFEAFPGLKAYFNQAKQQGLTDGYIFISQITKRKSYLPFYDRYAELARKMTKQYWMKYRQEKVKGGPVFDEMRKDVKDYFYYQGEIERKSLNYPIQGQSGEITKIASTFIFNYILDNKLFGIVKFCNTIHDELVLECPTEMAEEIAKMVENYMNKAASFYCKRVPLTATPELSLYWKK